MKEIYEYIGCRPRPGDEKHDGSCRWTRRCLPTRNSYPLHPSLVLCGRDVYRRKRVPGFPIFSSVVLQFRDTRQIFQESSSKRLLYTRRRPLSLVFSPRTTEEEEGTVGLLSTFQLIFCPSEPLHQSHVRNYRSHTRRATFLPSLREAN